METIVSIIVFLLLILVSAYFILLKPILRLYGKKVSKVYPLPVGSGNLLVKEFKKEISAYNSFDSRSKEAENNILDLEFPIPQTPNQNGSASKIITDLTGQIDLKSEFFSGSQHIILAVLPPEFIVETITFLANDLAEHSSQAAAETIISIKDGFLNGVDNLSDPDVLLQCAEKFFAEIAKHLSNPENLEALELAYAASGMSGAVLSVVGPLTILKSFDPAFHYSENLKHVGEIFKNHAVDVTNDFSDFTTDNYEFDPTPHVPWFTIIFSSAKEIRLLSQNKTDVETSIKNIVLDITGTGLGTLFGSLGFSILGDLLFPGLGTGLTLLIGGAAGGYGGRKVTNKLKRIALNDAVDDFKTCSSNMEYSLKIIATDGTNKVREMATETYILFLEKIGHAPKVDPNHEEIGRILFEIANDRRKKLRDVKIQIRELKTSVFSRLPKYRRIIKSLDSLIFDLEKDLPNPSVRCTYFIQALENVINGSFIVDDEHVRLMTRKLENLRNINADLSGSLVRYTANAAKEYQIAYSKIVDEVVNQIEVYKTANKQWQSKLEYKLKSVRTEQDKLDIKY